MVIGRERNNWYADHPPACTCANCEASRADRRRFEITTEGKKIGRRVGTFYPKYFENKIG